VDGVPRCQMFNRAIGRQPAPTYLSSDHDPLYRFHPTATHTRSGLFAQSKRNA
jgi:hypothetical protein